MGEKSKEFKCPICGCTEYEYKLHRPVRFGGGNVVDYYFCKGCSVVFKDLEKFSQVKR